MGLQRDRAGPLGDLGGGRLRGGHHQDLRAGQQLGQRDGDVAGTGGQVEQEYVEVAPVHVGEELLQRPVQHRAAPHHGGVAAGEHADRDDLHPVRARRHDHVFDLGRPLGHPQHSRHGVAVDIRVDHAHGEPASRQGGRQVDRDAGLAHAALAAGDAVHPGARPRLRERDDRLGTGRPAQSGLQRLALLLRHHAEVDRHAGHPRYRGDRLGDVVAQLVLQRAAGDGEQDAQPYRAARVHGHRLDHVQFGDRPVDLRILHGGERVADGRFDGSGRGRHAAHATGWTGLPTGCDNTVRNAAHLAP